MTAATLVGQTRMLLRRDLKVETRTGEALAVTLPFAATALLLIPLAVGANVTLLRQLAPGLYWAVVLLFGVLVTARQSSLEPPAHREALTLLGVEPAAWFLARTATSALLLTVMQAVLAPVAIVLYDPPLVGWAWIFAVAPLAAVGLGALGSVAAALTGRIRARAVVTPLLVVPLAVPLVVAGTAIVDGAVYGRSPLAWLVLLVAMDLLVVAVGVLLAPWAEPEERT